MPSQQTTLRTRGLSKTYGRIKAVDHLDLEVHAGELFGFLGPNGAGKTTTIRMALHLVRPTEGSVEVLGQDIARHARSVLPRVGALVESPALHLYLSGRDNLEVVADAIGGVKPARREELIELVGLKGREKDRVRTYSLGMKQRLGLAIALLNDPELLILDEPANGLDPAGVVEMRDLLRGLAAAGKTVFISSHVLSEVQQICSRVAIINKGRLVKVSSVRELLEQPGEYEVRVDDPERLAQVLKQHAWSNGARVEEGLVITRAPDGKGRELIAWLVQQGFQPDSVAERTRELEDVFLSLTGSESKP